jgi:hypothetical protein
VGGSTLVGGQSVGYEKNDLVLVSDSQSAMTCVVLHSPLPDYFHGDLGPFYFCWVIELSSYIVVYEYEIIELLAKDFVLDFLPDFDFAGYLDEYELFDKLKAAFNTIEDA